MYLPKNTIGFEASARPVIEASPRPELLQNAASGGVRERGERGIEAGPAEMRLLADAPT